MSVAGVVLANGLNANQMHRWMRERGIAPPSWRKPACAERTGLVAQPGFVPVQDAPSVEPPVIRLEAQRGKARSRAVAWGLRPAVGQNGSFCLIVPCHTPNDLVACPLMADSRRPFSVSRPPCGSVT